MLRSANLASNRGFNHMSRRGLLVCLMSITLWSGLGWIQSRPVVPPSPAKDLKKPRALHLTLVDSVIAPSEVASGFALPLWCDQDGDIYLASDEAAGAVRKMSPN